MNKISKLALSAAFTLGFTSFANAAPILGDILSGSNNSDFDEVSYLSDNRGSYVRLTDTDGNNDNIVAGIMLELAGLADENSFGLFKLGDEQNRIQVFSGSDTVETREVSLEFRADDSVWVRNQNVANDFGTTFGFYLERNGAFWYSDAALNDGIDAAGFYELPYAIGYISFIVAFEDMPKKAGQDFSDLVVGLSDVATVSEPGSLALLGLGLIGLGLSRNRKSKS